MRLTSWNLLHAMAIPPGSAASLPGAIKKITPEVLAIQEVDYLLPRSNSANQVQEIAKAMKAVDWAFAPSVIGTPGEKWRALNDNDESLITSTSKAAAKSKTEGGYGIGFASTIPVTAYERIELGRSLVGMPLLVPGGEDGKGKPRFIYVQDEPRVALVAHLENGWSIINTHLSFVPGVNIAQLKKLKRWAEKSAAQTGNKVAIIGDLNLPKGLPVVGSHWKSLVTQNTYPSWGAKIQFDYILTKDNISKVKIIKTTATGISDHLPITVEID
jgi:endonuclease/exonuclease/phosphatase family metal-dependent hydrolase